jgi:hypothetical protein
MYIDTVGYVDNVLNIEVLNRRKRKYGRMKSLDNISKRLGYFPIWSIVHQWTSEFTKALFSNWVNIEMKYFGVIVLTLTPPTWRRIWWAPNNANRWQMGFNLAFKVLMLKSTMKYRWQIWEDMFVIYLRVHAMLHMFVIYLRIHAMLHMFVTYLHTMLRLLCLSLCPTFSTSSYGLLFS